MNYLHYFKLSDEASGHPMYFEIESDGSVIRQIELISENEIRFYDSKKPYDDKGHRILELDLHRTDIEAISEKKFYKTWNANRQERTKANSGDAFSVWLTTNFISSVILCLWVGISKYKGCINFLQVLVFGTFLLLICFFVLMLPSLFWATRNLENKKPDFDFRKEFVPVFALVMSMNALLLGLFIRGYVFPVCAIFLISAFGVGAFYHRAQQ